MDVWPRDKQELDVILKPLEQVFSFYMIGEPVFGVNVEISKELIAKIFSYLDRRTLHLVIPGVSHRWRTLHHDYVLQKKRKKLAQY